MCDAAEHLCKRLLRQHGFHRVLPVGHALQGTAQRRRIRYAEEVAIEADIRDLPLLNLHAYLQTAAGKVAAVYHVKPGRTAIVPVPSGVFLLLKLPDCRQLLLR